ncbi:potassium transporter TrkG [Marivita geojedonensis]|uniref:Potassium transporter TrkH n=1 Tax=Marivita geojedonensis TaxID=1123756 RepID=A0A1X4NIQ9_9RHOB|nr:potassium transporter TrkG [Marivita geojedonensis]OSQ48620.1 potassium transporter TrkH [Marivita geojedonensis]PRY75168.1 trk system potassium uptake protein TrkH [Marivita geojedonensis]
MALLYRLPLLLLLTGLASASMIVPAAVALWAEAFHDARSFFYSGLVGLIFCTLIGLALANRPHNRNAIRQLMALLGSFVIVPAVLAVPFYEAVQTTSFLNAYLEMVSSLSTTGLPLFAPERLSMAEHLWRAQVGWMGGLLMWVAAAAILAPLNLGGFEVTSLGEPGQDVVAGAARRDTSNPASRLARSAAVLAPTYALLTLALWVLLLVVGDTPFVALTHAMSVMATSGISPVGGPAGGGSGIAGEAIMAVFLLFALSRMTFSQDSSSAQRSGLFYDPEFRLGLAIVLLVPLLLLLRHFVAALDIGDQNNFTAAARAFWGSAFTVLSFLTTHGFSSVDWVDAQAWSGLDTPGLILMGLALIGGGVATTAGGVKLLRVFALIVNGMREVDRLVHPSSVGRSGLVSRRTRREGAFIAWVFFMIFAITLAATTVALAAFNIPFEQSLVLAVASLSNCGPLISVVEAGRLTLLELGPGPKVILSLAMMMGRLEMLALVVILTPDLWRD